MGELAFVIQGNYSYKIVILYVALYQLILSVRNSSINEKTILITGSAGFIGSNLAMRVLKEFNDVTVPIWYTVPI